MIDDIDLLNEKWLLSPMNNTRPKKAHVIIIRLHSATESFSMFTF